MFRIGLNYYITHRFYKHEDSLGRQAQAASERARELNKAEGGAKTGGFFSQAKQQAEAKAAAQAKAAPTTSKRVTPPKNKPTPSASKGSSTARPPSTGKAARPDANNSKKK